MTFMVVQQTKEVGVRVKVLGASVAKALFIFFKKEVYYPDNPYKRL